MTLPTPKYITFHQYAGYLVRGNESVTISAEDQKYHMRCAAALTSMLECVHWGTVQGYDGAGMSGGLLHHIAVQPSSLDQGSLWGLLAAIVKSSPSSIVELENALLPWKIGADGVFRDAAGAKVTGQAIRGRLNGSPDGKTPPGDDIAKNFATLFYRLLSDPATYQAQLDYAIKWLCFTQRTAEYEAYAAIANPAFFQWIGGVRLVDELSPRSTLSAHADFAMCVYHAFSANGPGPAKDLLERALAKARVGTQVDPDTFAKTLVRSFGLSNFGHWHDDPLDQGSRYDATRAAAIASGFWPHELVDEYMPRNLV